MVRNDMMPDNVWQLPPSPQEKVGRGAKARMDQVGSSALEHLGAHQNTVQKDLNLYKYLLMNSRLP